MTGFKFSASSRSRLETCDALLVKVANEALATSPVDFVIACGHRGQAEQDAACRQGLSKVTFPNSKHNTTPSRAFDFYPAINGVAQWDNPKAFKDVAHHILMTADRLGVQLRWGGTWSDDADDRLAKFCDMPHIELKG